MRQALDDAAYTGVDALFHRQGFREDPDDAWSFRRTVLDSTARLACVWYTVWY